MELFKNLPDPTLNAIQKPAEPVIPTQATNPAPTTVTPTPASSPESIDDENDLQMPDEMTMLKQRATLMNIPYSNNIGLETLKAKVKAKMEGTVDNTDADGVEKKAETINTNSNLETNINNNEPEPVPVNTALSVRQYMQAEYMKLIRVRITNLDPKKKELHGEIFTVANEYLGTVRKFVPYGEVTDNGYHIPYCIYLQLKDRIFVSIKTRKDKRTGQTIVEHQDAKEFAIDVLPSLTAVELAQLATAQQAAGGLE